MSQYILLPRLEVKNANAQPAWWIIGPPPMTAYAGFAQALALSVCLDIDDRKGALYEGIAVVHHDIKFLGEISYQYGKTTLHPHQYRSASFIDADDYLSPRGKGEKKRPVLSSQPTARCHMAVSLIIRFDDDTVFNTDKVSSFLRGGRLAGGTIVDHGEIKSFKDDIGIDKVKKAVGSGYSIVERQDLMVMQGDDNDMLDVVLRMTRSENRDANPWLMPTTLGYVEITERRHRKNVRGGFLHAYAEPLVGLVQYKSIRDVGLKFWSYTHPKPNVHTVSTN
ncbi:hypothetical protein MNBD_NITROSPINAE03-125 [hydrothermal vent metagenome]|uniref:CRISPR-associated protein, Csy2 family n=1 Tax=hydrothermal vent metagenome TaxID=652676 RepID=A0A3B1CLV3_9ZZZZ